MLLVLKLLVLLKILLLSVLELYMVWDLVTMLKQPSSLEVWQKLPA